jgi:hypothetical protein
VTSGEAIGVEQTANVSLGPALSLRLKGTFQVTKSEIGTPTLTLSKYPGSVPRSLKQLPNFPGVQGLAELEWSRGNTLLTASLAYVGRRPRAFTRTATGGGLVTYVGTADEAIGLHLFARHRFGPSSSLLLGVFNLTKARFYEGYPASTTGFLGFEYRY